MSMDAKFNLNESLKVWGIGDAASAARQLAGAGLGDEASIRAALESGDLGGEALAKVRELAPIVAQQFPQLAAAVGYRVS